MGGVPLLVQASRSLGLPAHIREQVEVNKRERGLDEAEMVESFVVLNAMGGECFDDFLRLREDAGLKEMLGHGIPSPDAARRFLYQLHEQDKIEEARQNRGQGQIAYIPEENAALAGLGEVNRDLFKELGRRCPDQRIATVDEDATIIESSNKEALGSYEGERGYQPMLSVWAEMNVVLHPSDEDLSLGTLVLADEFRDGNVPAMMDPLFVVKRSIAALPETVSTYFFRGDSACHESNLVNWLRDEQRADGPRGPIGFAISTRMSPPLHEAIVTLPEPAWELYGKLHPEEIRECTEVDFVPTEKSEKKDTQPLRYLAIRIRSRQEGLFADGSKVKHFAVVTNIEVWKPSRLIQWHREKAGTIEGVHDVLKNESAATSGPRLLAKLILRNECGVVASGGAYL